MMEEVPLDPPEQPAKRCGSGLMKVVGCVVVALALVAGLGYVFGSRLGLRGMVQAADVGSDAQRQAADSLVKTLTSQVALYKLQHNDTYPDFAKYANWEQFTKYTDMRGNLIETANGGQRYGPYAKSVPQNPLNNLSTVAVVTTPVRPGDAVPNDQKVGFVFEAEKGRFFVTDVPGTRVIDPAAVVGAAPGKPAPMWKRAEATEKLESIVQTARSQLALYKLQHNDTNPDFVKYTNWEQLTEKTDNKGNPSRTERYGPYFKDVPSNPLHGGTRVQVVQTTPAASFKCTLGDVGFVFDASTGKLYALDADGKIFPK